MTGGKKSPKLKFSFYNISYIIIIVVFALFGLLKISGKSLYIFGVVFECYTFAFVSAFIILVVKFCNYLKKNDGNFDFKSGLLSASIIITFLCMINNISKDVKASKVKDVLPVSDSSDIEDISVVLCEVTEFNNMINDYSTHIDVYYVNGRIAEKIGFIDELYFSVECIKDGLYSYLIDKDNNTITIECSYGSFGDGVIMMNPEYATGEIRYIFKLN